MRKKANLKIINMEFNLRKDKKIEMEVVFIGKLIEMKEKESICIFESSGDRVTCASDDRHDLILLKYGYNKNICIKCGLKENGTSYDLYIKELIY